MDVWTNGVKAETNVSILLVDIGSNKLSCSQVQQVLICFPLLSFFHYQVQFVDGGNLISFSLTDSSAAIQSINSGNKKQGMLYQLTVKNGYTIIQENLDNKT